MSIYIMGINGHSLTFEQKVLRAVQAKYFDWKEIQTDDEIRRFIDTKMTKTELMKIQSEIFEEVFGK